MAVHSCSGPHLSINTPSERWQSGRLYRTRNAAYGQPYRGFESHPLRHCLSELISLRSAGTVLGPVFARFSTRPQYRSIERTLQNRSLTGFFLRTSVLAVESIEVK
jgi:hypothetical protein